MTFTGSLSPAPRISFTPPTVAEKVQETRVVEKVVAPPARSRWSRLVSFSTLFNIFLLYVLVSLAQEVQKLRSEVQFIADEQRDLRAYSYERTNQRWVERQSHDHGEDSAVRSDQSMPKAEPRDEEDAKPDLRATPGLGTTTASEAEPTGSNSETLHQTQSTGSHSVVSATSPNYGLGRVVLKRTSWKDWINHPS